MQHPDERANKIFKMQHPEDQSVNYMNANHAAMLGMHQGMHGRGHPLYGMPGMQAHHGMMPHHLGGNHPYASHQGMQRALQHHQGLSQLASSQTLQNSSMNQFPSSLGPKVSSSVNEASASYNQNPHLSSRAPQNGSFHMKSPGMSPYSSEPTSSVDTSTGQPRINVNPFLYSSGHPSNDSVTSSRQPDIIDISDISDISSQQESPINSQFGAMSHQDRSPKTNLSTELSPVRGASSHQKESSMQNPVSTYPTSIQNVKSSVSQGAPSPQFRPNQQPSVPTSVSSEEKQANAWTVQQFLEDSEEEKDGDSSGMFNNMLSNVRNQASPAQGASSPQFHPHISPSVPISMPAEDKQSYAEDEKNDNSSGMFNKMLSNVRQQASLAQGSPSPQFNSHNSPSVTTSENKQSYAKDEKDEDKSGMLNKMLSNVRHQASIAQGPPSPQFRIPQNPSAPASKSAEDKQSYAWKMQQYMENQAAHGYNTWDSEDEEEDDLDEEEDYNPHPSGMVNKLLSNSSISIQPQRKEVTQTDKLTSTSCALTKRLLMNGSLSIAPQDSSTPPYRPRTSQSTVNPTNPMTNSQISIYEQLRRRGVSVELTQVPLNDDDDEDHYSDEN